MPNDFQAQGDTIDDAVLAMPDIVDDAPPAANAPPRDETTGQFRARGDNTPPGASKINAATIEQDAAAEDEDTSPVDEEWFEIPAAKPGEKPQRLKAAEVWEKAQSYERVRAELEEARQVQAPPEEYDRAIYESLNQTAALRQRLNHYMRMLAPQRVDHELINEESPRYNPGQYQRQLANAQQRAQELAAIQQEEAGLARQQQEQMAAVQQAQFRREQSRLHQFWPEIRDPAEANRVRDALIANYGRFGVTADLIGSVTNAAFYALAKDALAYRNGLKAQEAAIKVVRAKPKLVRGAARDSQPPKARQAAASMQRLQASGSIEDAAAALDGLF